MLLLLRNQNVNKIEAKKVKKRMKNHHHHPLKENHERNVTEVALLEAKGNIHIHGQIHIEREKKNHTDIIALILVTMATLRIGAKAVMMKDGKDDGVKNIKGGNIIIVKERRGDETDRHLQDWYKI